MICQQHNSAIWNMEWEIVLHVARIELGRESGLYLNHQDAHIGSVKGLTQ